MDIRWWDHFTGRFNGKAKMLRRFAVVKAMYSDVSNWGLGTTFGDNWLVAAFGKEDVRELEGVASHHCVNLPNGIAEQHINIKEMRAVVEGEKRWAPYWGDSEIIFITDSVVVQAALSTGRS